MGMNGISAKHDGNRPKFEDSFLAAIDAATGNDGNILYGDADMTKTDTYKFFSKKIDEFTKGKASVKGDQLDELAKSFDFEDFGLAVQQNFGTDRTYSAQDLAEFMARTFYNIDMNSFDAQEEQKTLADYKADLAKNPKSIIALKSEDGSISVEEAPLLNMANTQEEQLKIRIAFLKDKLEFLKINKIDAALTAREFQRELNACEAQLISLTHSSVTEIN